MACHTFDFVFFHSFRMVRMVLERGKRSNYHEYPIFLLSHSCCSIMLDSADCHRGRKSENASEKDDLVLEHLSVLDSSLYMDCFLFNELGELLMNIAMLAGILCSIPFYLLYRKVINSYRMSQCEISFWTEKRWNYGATILSGSIILLYILLLVFLYSLEHPELWNYSA